MQRNNDRRRYDEDYPPIRRNPAPGGVWPGRRRRHPAPFIVLGIFCAVLVCAVLVSLGGYLRIESTESDSARPLVTAEPAINTFKPAENCDEAPAAQTPQASAEKTFPEANGFLILVNWENPVPYDRPPDLVPLTSVFGNEVLLVNAEGSVDRTAGLAAEKMFQDAARDGIGRYRLASAYRSIVYQNRLWNNRRKEDPTYGDDHYNVPVKAMPGNMSEHTTGLALDILAERYDNADDGYGMTPEGRWLYENAYRYGFILRYPKDKENITGVIYEPWHYRYVGVEAAAEIHEKGLCLEEYLGKVPDTETVPSP